MSHTVPAPDPARSLLPILTAALLLQLLISHFQLDFRLAHWWYQLQGGHWALREHWLLADVIHAGGRRASVLLAVICLLAWGGSLVSALLRPWRRLLAYLALAPVLASGAVLLVKRTSGVECPWSLQPFGGDQPYRPLLEQLLAPGEGACFPAGHASAGYAWFALYFAATVVCPRWRRPVLLAVLLTGAVFGLAQQLRGAHFLSHDLWSLTLCWSVCAGLAARMLRPPMPAWQPAL